MISFEHEVTDELLDALGFTPYDDEHCTWGNRRLKMPNSILQIIDYGDFPEENDRPAGFAYAGWFTHPWNLHPNNNDHRELETLADIHYVVASHHPTDLPWFEHLIANT